MIRAHRIFVAFVLITMSVASAACSTEEEVKITPLSEILSGRVPDGREVVVEGTVTDVEPLPAVSRTSYQLSTKGSSVPVITAGEAPPLTQELRVVAVVRARFKARNLVLGTVLEERDRQSLPIEEEGSALIWLWVAIGSAVLLLVVFGISLALASRRRRMRGAVVCPHCGAMAEAGWAACTECGKALDAKPPVAPTIIAPPPIPPAPTPEESAEERRRSAPTVLIPPDEEDFA